MLNTDAEGRLVLADALAYAVVRVQPAAVIDIATLTGAATLGLGRRHAALYSTSPSLRDALIDAGRRGGVAGRPRSRHGARSLRPYPDARAQRSSHRNPLR